MEDIRFIREILHYLERYKRLRLGVKIGRLVLGDEVVLAGIMRDIDLLRELGVNVFLFHSEPNTDLSRWLNGVPVMFCQDKNGLSDDEIIAKLAVDLKLDKLIFLTHFDGVFVKQVILRQITTGRTRKLSKSQLVTGGMLDKLNAALIACEGSINRVHIINGLREGSLLKELFSGEGVGTMIYCSSPYRRVRQAQEKDVLDIVDILTQNEFMTAPIVVNDIAAKVTSFFVFVVDGEIYGCLRLVEHRKTAQITTAEISYLAAASSYNDNDSEICKRLLAHVIKRAQKDGYENISLNVETIPLWIRLYPWFLELDFQKTSRSPSKPKNGGGAKKFLVKKL